VKIRRIDIHGHLNFADFDADREEAVRRAFDSGTAFIAVGTSLEASRSAVSLAERYPEGAYAMVGQHPTEAGEPFDPAAYSELLKSPKTVGIGECGLDYFYSESDSKDKQREAFLAHIALANETGKPLMLHIRPSRDSADAYDDALDILKAHAKVKGDAHFFAGTKEQAKRFLDMGFTISFTGVITFAKQYAKLVEYVPIDMIQAETDCPFVAPVPYRGKRNEPAYVAEVVKKIAELKKLPLTDVEDALLENARRVWGIEI
jgi:TatD DNase family protein